MIDRQSKYFRLQIGSKQDSVSVDRFKPVFSDGPIVPALPPPRGRPLRPPETNPPDPPPSSTIKAKVHKKVRFQTTPQLLPPPVQNIKQDVSKKRGIRVHRLICNWIF